MKPVALLLADYSLPLRRPLPRDRDQCMERKGLLVGLESESGAVAWGDVAPLPGFSPETLDAARRELREDRSLLKPLAAAFAVNASPEMLLAALSEHDLSSAARFGLETAMLNLWADVEGTAWHGQLGWTPRGTVSVNALLDGDDLACSAEACLDQGYRSIKIKVGVHAPEQDAERVALLSALINGRAGLRLDANGAWEIDEALRFASALGDHEIDYIEEPLRNLAELARFIDETDLPVALDESLPESAGSGITVKAWVIKPTIQGGISGALKLCAGARECGATPVISACFESGVGIRALAQLAACVGDEGVPVGLDTGKWLAEDVIEPAVSIENGCIDVDNLVAFVPRLLIG